MFAAWTTGAQTLSGRSGSRDRSLRSRLGNRLQTLAPVSEPRPQGSGFLLLNKRNPENV